MLLAEDCWLYKIPGKDPSRNILLMSHHDVVPADTDWTMPAFEGIIKDGKVYVNVSESPIFVVEK